MISQVLPMTYDNPRILVDAAKFDGATNYATRGGGLTGAVDSKTGILSGWLRLDGGDSSLMTMFCGASVLASTGFWVTAYRNAGNQIDIFARNAAGAIIFEFVTPGTYLASAAWLHVLCSWDLTDPAKRFLYVNDAAALSVLTYTNDTIKYTLGDWGFGADCSGGVGTKLNGALAELYFAPGQYLDFSLPFNRRKFISYNGKPVHLGPTGALPTGTVPLVYQHLDVGQAVANFATNKGSGGNFGITGALATASSSPST